MKLVERVFRPMSALLSSIQCPLGSYLELKLMYINTITYVPMFCGLSLKKVLIKALKTTAIVKRVNFRPFGRDFCRPISLTRLGASLPHAYMEIKLRMSSFRRYTYYIGLHGCIKR